MCVWAPDATLTGGESVNCHLDGLGRRVARQVSGGAWICLIYQDNAHQIGMVDASGNVTEQVVYGTRGNSPDYMIKNGVSYRIISDERGSVRLVVNATDGTVAQRMDYDVWGNVTADTAPGFQPFGFAGGIYDSVTGLVRFGARDYDASTGRWTAKDPILFNGGQANLYVYAGNDPVNRIDPHGLAVYAVGAEVSAIFGIGAGAGGGLYISTDPGKFDIGIYSSLAEGAGLNAGGFVGFTRIDSIDHFNGSSCSVSAGNKLIGGSATFNGTPSPSNFTGGSFGVGFGLPTAGSVTSSYTTSYGIRGLAGFLANGIGNLYGLPK